jgi:hypothetical protein
MNTTEPSSSQFSKVSRAPGLATVFVFVALEVLMLVSTRGELTRAFWVVLYVGVGIVTGVLFWILTPGSTGEFNFKGVLKLTGGAAIGAAFMYLAYWLTIPTSTEVIAPFPSDIPQGQDINIKATSDAIADVGEVRTTGQRKLIYAKLQDGQDSGTLEIKFPDAGKEKTFVTKSYRVILGEKQLKPLPRGNPP